MPGTIPSCTTRKSCSGTFEPRGKLSSPAQSEALNARATSALRRAGYGQALTAQDRVRAAEQSLLVISTAERWRAGVRNNAARPRIGRGSEVADE